MASFMGTTGNDTLIGGIEADVLSGLDGNDSLTGGSGDDILDGGAGTDTAFYNITPISRVIVDLAAGTATGGDGSDTLISIENVVGSAYNDILLGDAGPNVLDGDGGDDYLNGREGNDTLRGGDGNDILFGANGDDSLDGGAGIDSAYYNGATSRVIVDLTEGTATGGDGNDTLISIENVLGSIYNDILLGDAGPNVLDGDGGDDYLNGRDGDNTLRGGDGNDTLTAGSGNDVLDGGAGVDSVFYNAATSRVIVDLTDGTATGGGGSDTLISIENVLGSIYNDILLGDAGPNVLDGDGGDDYLNGRDGNDTLRGGDGNDILVGGNGDDSLDGGAGIDSAYYNGATSAVSVNLTDGTASGGDGNDTLVNIENVLGSQFNDTLIGDAGPNLLDGANGDDFLAGRGGDDTIDGGDGTDTAVFIGPLSEYTVTIASVSPTSSTVTYVVRHNVADRDGTDTVSNVEFFRFSDGTVTAASLVVTTTPSVAFSSSTASTVEGNSGSQPLAFTVNLSGTATSAVTVNYTTANATATAGSDYTATSGTLTFAIGETSKTVTVAVLGDTVVEPDETFTLTLSSPSGATLGIITTTTATIVNDDAAPVVILPTQSRLDDFVVLQLASPAIVGADTGNDTYLISGSMVSAGQTLTISDTSGSNSVQLASGLSIASSQVTSNALKLTLSNGGTVTVLNADLFTYDVGGNTSAGIDNIDVSYASFAQTTLGVALPSSGIASGGAKVIGSGSAMLSVAGSSAFISATNSMSTSDANGDVMGLTLVGVTNPSSAVGAVV